MRVLKENTLKYEPFSKTLQYFTKGGDTEEYKRISFETHQSKTNLFEKYSYLIQNLFSFQKSVAELKTPEEIHNLFSQYVKRIVASKEVDLFLFDDTKRNLVAVNPNVSSLQNNLVNKAYKNGILDWIFETQKPTLIPDLNSYTGEGVRLYQTIFPVNYVKNNIGVLSLLGPANKISENSIENQTIYVLLGIIVPQIISFNHRKTINKLYDEVQLYESKLNNDFKLYAVGEFAEGIIQDMLNSLQVIQSGVDYIESTNTAIENEIFEKIKERISRLSSLSQKLLKFNDINTGKTKQNLPCDINNVIKEFYGIINSTLKNMGLECALDLEEHLPPILTSPKEIKQILTNIFSMIKKKSKSGSGIVIQTKYINEIVILSVFITDYWENFGEPSDYVSNLTVKIIQELMKKSEGKVEFDSLPLKGTSIHLLFPLKRKLKE
ncbi:MAG: hypothetical protein QHH13_07685 [Melioribacter sp.]|uniref:sensor histidine kinase n=1 Tax=Rosettibacter primus TaxID=3111523 RepID=UPI00247E0E9D|nr:hypothetical protein [Melioribacter sp.]